jgi:hypothetical protein
MTGSKKEDCDNGNNGNNGQQRATTGNNGQQRATTGNNRQQRATTGSNGQQRAATGNETEKNNQIIPEELEGHCNEPPARNEIMEQKGRCDIVGCKWSTIHPNHPCHEKRFGSRKCNKLCHSLCASEHGLRGDNCCSCSEVCKSSKEAAAANKDESVEEAEALLEGVRQICRQLVDDDDDDDDEEEDKNDNRRGRAPFEKMKRS